MASDLHVLLYVPNIIGYIRLLLLFVSWFLYYSNPAASVIFYIVSISLDAIDGYVARKLHQCSAFGAWFDVVIDVLSRGMLWCRIYHFGYLVPSLEWLTFVCTHSLGAEWKSKFVSPPWWVEGVMANNFKTPLGVSAIGGLQVLPIWLYGHYHGVLDLLNVPYVLQYLGIALLAAGRALCMAVELWCIGGHIQYLTSKEANSAVNDQSSSENTTEPQSRKDSRGPSKNRP